MTSLNSVQLGEDFVSFTSATGRQTYPGLGLSGKHEGLRVRRRGFRPPKVAYILSAGLELEDEGGTKEQKAEIRKRILEKEHGNLTVLKFAGMIAKV